MDEERILSIQSHVASGYVGNRAATFPLQVLGFDVDVVNTVQYSNHAGYRRFGGNKTSAEDLDSIFENLERNGILQPARLLTGYIPNASALESVARLVKKLRAEHPNLVYLLDPVMGDDNRLYVSPDVVPIYRDILAPSATIITPNWYEVELLTGVKITDVMSIRTALRCLHTSLGIPHVVISSIPVTSVLRSSLPGQLVRGQDLEGGKASIFAEDEILCISSSAAQDDRTAATGKVSLVHALTVPRILGYYSGVGDLFSALVLAHYDPSLANAHEAVAGATAKALASVQAILVRTYEHSQRFPPSERPETDEELDAADPERRVRRMRTRELRIVQSIDIIRGEGLEVPPMADWGAFWGEKEGP